MTFYHEKLKMRIGIDIHGVLDKHSFFKAMAKVMRRDGSHIHIITGTTKESALKDLALLGMKQDIHYDYLFSITDYLIEKGITVEWKDGNNPLFPHEEWDKAKGEYCARNNIDIHFDDTVRYGEYFTTPFALIR